MPAKPFIALNDKSYCRISSYAAVDQRHRDRGKQNDLVALKKSVKVVSRDTGHGRESVGSSLSAVSLKEPMSPTKTYGSFRCGAAPRELIERRPYSSGPFMPPYKVATDATIIPRN